MKNEDLIIDIGSNDGSFLGFLKKYKLIGVDPTIKKLKNFIEKILLKLIIFLKKNLLEIT